MKLPFPPQAGEQIIKIKPRAAHLKSMLNMQTGTLALTNQRLVFHKPINFMFGLIGLLAKSNRGGLVVNLPLASIRSVEAGTHGVQKNLLQVVDAEGKAYKFLVSLEEWGPLLEDARHKA
jgi:hypothetical protein